MCFQPVNAHTAKAALRGQRKIFFYKMTHDDPFRGRAPNLLPPALTVASCYPASHGAAIEVGDIVVGLCGNWEARGSRPRLNYVAEVSEVLKPQEYKDRVRTDAQWSPKTRATNGHDDIIDHEKTRRVIVSTSFYHWRSNCGGEAAPQNHSRKLELPFEDFTSFTSGTTKPLREHKVGIIYNALSSLPQAHQDFFTELLGTSSLLLQ